MKPYSLLVVVGLVLMNASTAYAGSNTALKSASTLPSSDPAETIVHLATTEKPEAAKPAICQYKTWQDCVAACGTSLCIYCTGNGKYACEKEK
ncbi:hypothetical protein [Brucella pituitosa]|uniref:Uncharacterized protein n=1 Tax=Brucella pituitosa TaxID=571256 RepID=A0A643ESC9_9HYPH|nr:hypothetical protein [Brucella pituitosa]KAB0564353.1 hypothetical protein F7Q93_24585 [Brucella pituitosa]